MAVFKSFLELLPVLVENAYLLPYHESFGYYRNQGKRSSLTSYPPLKPSPNVRCPMLNVIWHNERLNLSIHTGITGTVALKDHDGIRPEALGLTRNYPAQIYRTFQLVRDGKYHIDYLPLAFFGPEGDSLKAVLQSSLREEGGGVFSLRLSDFPIIYNDDKKVDLEQLCLDYREKLYAKAQNKMLKYVCKEIFPAKKKSDVTLGELQRDFLTVNGIDPETGTSASEWTQEAKEEVEESVSVTLEMKGFSSFPPADKVWNNYHKGKKQNPSGQAMSLVLRDLDLLTHKVGGTAEQINGYFIPRIEQLQKRIRFLHSNILEKKFLAFSKKQFAEANVHKVFVDGDEFTFKISG